MILFLAGFISGLVVSGLILLGYILSMAVGTEDYKVPHP